MSQASAAQSPWQTARIVRIEKRTPRVTSFFFRLSRPFAHQAGQHVDVRLTAPDGYQARRSYSIASAPESG
ncbi:MAG: oxidoreductase, partial [Mesorhizobium sp.]